MGDGNIEDLNRGSLQPSRAVARTAGHSARTVLLCLIAALQGVSAACAASNPPVIWERGDQIVTLAPQDDPAAPPNDHPVDVTAGEVAAMLASLNMRFVDESPEVPPISVFTRDEVTNLSAALATGLGRARPSEDIEFHMIGSRRTSPGAFTKRNRVTAGRVFSSDGDINIIFGQVQTPYRKRNLYGQRDQDFYPRNYGSRVSQVVHAIDLLATTGVRFQQGPDGDRKDWLVIDPQAAVAAAPAAQGDAESASAAGATAAAVGAAGASVAAGGSTGIDEAAAEPAAMDLEQRLSELKRLFEAGLISEEAYQVRMQEILQDL